MLRPIVRILLLCLWIVAPVRGEAPAGPPKGLTARDAVGLMGRGINIGNTLENTTTWETGWGNPPITRAFVEQLARLGFRTVRLPVAWDTYAADGRIPEARMARVREVAGWITGAGMFCVINIHWDGGWIDSSNKERFAATHATFSPVAERKFRDYWRQIATAFASEDEKVIFEALNEETDFSGEGSQASAYATLTRVNQLFVDTVRASGGNNARRLLIVTGYATDIEKTANPLYQLPVDPAPHRLLLSVHYYTPWQFAGLEQDASWGKVQPAWGSKADVEMLERLFDRLRDFCAAQDIPAFIGEFNVTEKRDKDSRIRWLTAVSRAATARGMVPVLWDTGGEVSRRPPHAPSAVLRAVLER